MAASRRSQAEYQKRMHAVVEHIDRHLDQKLDLDTLAEAAARLSIRSWTALSIVTGVRSMPKIRTRPEAIPVCMVEKFSQKPRQQGLTFTRRTVSRLPIMWP